jgi:hypothetical protein
MAPRLAAVMPLPSDETTPPVMKMNRVIDRLNKTPTARNQAADPARNE